jgi:hypothetical protein
VRSRSGLLLIGAVLVLGQPAPAQAGMPAVTLTDVARLRLQGISFFLALFLLASWCLRWLWNRLGQDFPSLPRLSYGKAVGVVCLWGLLFVLVLTMISGARELLTPGAWVKQGLTYRLAPEASPTPAPPDAGESARRRKLEELRFALWDYARTHQGRFPPSSAVSEIPPERWQVPDPSGMRYIYTGGFGARPETLPLALEPDIFGGRRFVLLGNGEIRQLDSEEIARALGASKP